MAKVDVMGKNPPSYVAMAFDRRVDVVATNRKDGKELLRLGFTEIDGSFRLVVANEGDKAAAFSTLRDKGFVFSLGKEWSPSEIFHLLTEKRLIAGRFVEIAWSSPSQWHLHDKLG